jgi:hypothetical protein
MDKTKYSHRAGLADRKSKSTQGGSTSPHAQMKFIKKGVLLKYISTAIFKIPQPAPARYPGR